MSMSMSISHTISPPSAPQLRSRIPMARILSPISSSAALLRPSRLLTLRRRSHCRDDSSAPPLIEIDLDAEGDPSGMRRLEDAIHGIIVRRSRPDWLPFLPGSSYWVPPQGKRAQGLVDLVGRLADPLDEEEVLAMTTGRGWPSLEFFVEGTLPHPVDNSLSLENPLAQSDDEE